MQMRKIFVGAAVLAVVSFVFSGQSDYFSGLPKYLMTNFWVPGQPGFDYYKFSLTWPPSACSSPPPGKHCVKNPPPQMFTIHGLWPQRVGDVAVSPYANDRTCTTATPTPEANIAVTLIPIQAQLKTNWPNLFSTVDLDFWKYEWRRHGMCSGFPNNPAAYFQNALNLHQTFNKLPTALGITLGQWYKAGDILEQVHKTFGVYPQIACNKVGNIVQLWEIRFCYQRAKPILQDCPCRLAFCEYHTQIVLPQ